MRVLGQFSILPDGSQGEGMSTLKIISGGQTGVDRAALDAALDAGFTCGGACPHGRRAEDGVIPERYPLHALASPHYADRTRANVHQSDATLILAWGLLAGGTRLTAEEARAVGRPLQVVDLTERPGVEETLRWMGRGRYSTLNVAGPRASEDARVYPAAKRFMQELLMAYRTQSSEGA